jgi:hypothetical protein
MEDDAEFEAMQIRLAKGDIARDRLNHAFDSMVRAVLKTLSDDRCTMKRRAIDGSYCVTMKVSVGDITHCAVMLPQVLRVLVFLEGERAKLDGDIESWLGPQAMHLIESTTEFLEFQYSTLNEYGDWVYESYAESALKRFGIDGAYPSSLEAYLPADSAVPV